MDLRRALAVLVATLAAMAFPRLAHGFCGFYVSPADGKLVADATQVVLMREGTRTVLSMQNDYKGPLENFAVVVPVPVVLQKENVKVLPRELFDRIDKLDAPRLVEYWEEDPCMYAGGEGGGGIGLGMIGTVGHGAGVGMGYGYGRVRVEAQFAVGEYEIVILSAQDSSGLDAWLRDHNYKIPANAEPVLRPYVQAGSKFFVAKVDITKVKKLGDHAELSPLRFHYDSDRFELPVRLGMLSSSGKQDLVVHVLAPNGLRYSVANYANVTIPTNLDVAEGARARFGAFYAALFDKTTEKTPNAVVTEYSWPSSSCDPCPGDVQGLRNDELASLGADVLPSAQLAPSRGAVVEERPMSVSGAGKLAPKAISLRVRREHDKFRVCYMLGLGSNPKLAGTVRTRFVIGRDGQVAVATDGGSDIGDVGVSSCIAKTIGRLSFPEPEGGIVMVDYAVALGRDPGNVVSAIGTGFVLTRLHMRYGKDALGNDLVFQAASPITGGREERSAQGALEHGVTTSSANAFQARYAIRHPWTGPIACKHPIRGNWGGPPANQPTSSSAATSAARVGSVARGGIELAFLVPGGVPELGIASLGRASASASASSSAGAPAPSASTDPPPSASPPGPSSSPADAARAASRCVHGVASRTDAPIAVGFLALAVALARRLRRGSA